MILSPGILESGNFRGKTEEGIKGVVKYNSILNTSNLSFQLIVKICIYQILWF